MGVFLTRRSVQHLVLSLTIVNTFVHENCKELGKGIKIN
jgi:hypothetical protein